MCVRVKCAKCGKPSWSGCGAHIEQALAGVPEASRCHCREEEKKQGTEPREAEAQRRF